MMKMKMEDEVIYSLIAKSLTNNLTPAESEMLNGWVSINKDHKAEFNDIVELWKRSGEVKFPGKIDTTGSLKKVYRNGGIKKIFRIGIFGQVAAILLISMLFSGIYSYFNSKSDTTATNIFYQEVKAAFGTQTNLELPDGTVVLLNSGSSLRFPNSFENLQERHVVLNGEGFFKVSENKENPFIVNAGRLDIKVLGTTFNVNAYDPHSEIIVALVEGKVAISKANSAPSASLLALSPNQLAIFNESQNKIYKETNIDLSKYIAWTEGKIVFIDDSISVVIKKLEQWYNVDIKLADKNISKYRFTGTFFNEPIEEILHTLSLTSPMRYKILPALDKNDGTIPKRRIIISTK